MTKLGTTDAPFNPDWPETKPVSVPDDTVCALLSHDRDDAPATVSLAVPPKDAAPLTSASRPVDVEDGHGALVLATDGAVTDRGTTYLVDAGGRAYKFGAQSVPVEDLLGYGDVTLARVPSPWISVLGQGPELSSDAARRAARSAG